MKKYYGEKSCEHCGKSFEVFNLRSHKYCGEECQKAAARIRQYEKLGKSPPKEKSIQCKNCGKVFIAFDKASQRKYCSRKCYRDFHSKCNVKSSEWKRRFEVFKRDNFTCQYCGSNPKEDGVKIECEHIIPKSKGGADTMGNLITACRGCNVGKSDTELSERNLLHIRP